ncbi:alpha/beta fold hydrolase [Amycolatopsis sp. NBC_01480]|uniref:alpha/beta fold hydrolase n=1 Tax=Amycolatopsis sp. NBC_01480 TaxID=2903562 RepID=UPI002E299651|nr:alpha/beta hydrolase [Amycolatopsis sp. NBC_01480]
MFYTEQGQGERALVLLPGFGCSTDIWRPIADRLAGFRLVLLDLPGHAGSAGVRTDGHLPGLADLVRNAVHEVVAPPYTVLGYSLGGAIGLRMALDHPDEIDALVGVVPWNAAGTSAQDPVLSGFDAAFGDADSITQGVAAISSDPSKTARLAQDMLTVSEEMWHGWLAGGALTSQADQLATLRVPTCYVLAGGDTVVDLSKQIDDVRAMPAGRAVLLSGMGHLCGYEAPDAVAREITRYLSAGSVPKQPAS